MPQPLRQKPGEFTVGGYEILAERPDCALGIAQVASAWAWLEFQLGETFRLATTEITPHGTGNRFAPNPLAAAAFGALESLSARLAVIEASLELVIPEAVAPFAALAIEIRSCAKGRNKIVHSCWGKTDRYPKDVIRMINGFSTERWTKKDFANVVEAIEQQSGQIRAFLESCVSIVEKKRLAKLGGRARAPQP